MNLYSTKSRFFFLVVITVTGIFLTGCSQSDSVVPGLYEGFGDYKRTISTTSDEAQAFFNQGIQLMYGFNHDEAIRSFQAAAEADSQAAMPWWGIAYSHGVNINDVEMGEERSLLAREASDNALERIGSATPSEAALITAVSARYEYPAPADRSGLDLAFADAMEAAYKKFPQDPEVGTIFADSLMNLQPWDYWENDGRPKGRVEEIVAVLEKTMELHPQHPGANHFYIHTVEASQDPDRAVPAADRLRTLVPGAGHLVHMPSHIYIRVGRYAEAVDVNAEAVDADRVYFEKAPEPDMYATYFAHNLHFLTYAAMMSGRFEDAMGAARDLENEMPEEPLKAYAGLIDGIMPSNFHTLIRFGKWEEILQEPAYKDYRLVSNAVRFYARSIANSALGRTKEARVEMEAFNQAMTVVPEDWFIFNNPVNKVLPIAQAMIEGELFWREGKKDKAFARLRDGIEVEDALIYDEPPGWMLPVRHALGALLMADGRVAEAETVYREDLKRNRNNGWGLIGLQKSLRAQGKNQEAQALDSKIKVAWASADVRPTSSCYCESGAAVN
jgi:tetratricopeptide (TPR) repeat protein